MKSNVGDCKIYLARESRGWESKLRSRESEYSPLFQKKQQLIPLPSFFQTSFVNLLVSPESNEKAIDLDENSKIIFVEDEGDDEMMFVKTTP